MQKSSLSIIILVVGVIAYYIGYSLQKNKKEIEEKAVEIAVNQGVQHFKSETAVTKDWFNQLKNTVKQAWK